MYMYVYIYIYIYIHMMCGSKLSGFLSGVDRGRVQSSALQMRRQPVYVTTAYSCKRHVIFLGYSGYRLDSLDVWRALVGHKHA